jgi:3-phenylpropionate/cinnamic acid dioxygenase small subunit
LTDAELRELKDRAEIERLLYRYAEMVDRKNWPLMDRVFALEATIDYTTSGGIKGPFREALAWLARALEAWPINLHHISNVSVDFDGEAQARSHCYFLGQMGRANPDGSQLVLTNAGSYVDRLVRTNDGWRIVERYCDQTVMQGSLPEGYEIPR